MADWQILMDMQLPQIRFEILRLQPQNQTPDQATKSRYRYFWGKHCRKFAQASEGKLTRTESTITAFSVLCGLRHKNVFYGKHDEDPKSDSFNCFTTEIIPKKNTRHSIQEVVLDQIHLEELRRELVRLEARIGNLRNISIKKASPKTGRS